MGKITPAEFARRNDLSRARVSQLMQGILEPAIIRVPGKKRVLLDEQKASAFYRAFSDPAKQRNRTQNSEYTEARLLNMEYQNKILAAKIEKKKARYVSKAEVQSEIRDAYRIIEKNALDLPRQMAAKLAKEKDEIKVLKIINDKTRKCLFQIADDLDREE
jgi:hypothetical protein